MPGTINSFTARRLALAAAAAVTLISVSACEPTTTTTNSGSGGSSTVATSSPGSPGGGSGSGNGGSGGGNGACTGGQIKVTTTFQGDAETHRGMILIFTNTGNSACSLSGYPGAALTEQNGHQWNAPRTLSGYMGGVQGSSTPPTVHLNPGAAASAILEWDAATTNGQSTSTADCPGLNSTSLLVTPPNTQTTSTFPATYLQDACTLFTIHPVVPGTTGQG